MITAAFALNISRLLFGGNDPAVWNCPIQVGLPYLLGLAEFLLMFVAALAFLFGIFYAVFNYLTAYGNEDKIKTANQTLRWTIIGAVVVILSYFIIFEVVGLLLAPGQTAPLSIFPVKPESCTANQSDAQFQQSLNEAQQTREQVDTQQKSSLFKPGFATGGTGGVDLSQ